MNCPECDAPISEDDLFCTECGYRVAQQTAETDPDPVPEDDPVVVPAELSDRHEGDRALSGPPPQEGTFEAEISRQNPGCLIFLIDQSGSMQDPIAGGEGKSKKQVVADAVNRLLHEIVLRCTKEDVKPRHYFDVGIWSYGGRDQVEPIFGADLLSVADVVDQVKRMEKRARRVPDGAGGVIEVEDELPIWFEPVANGLTPMCAAFRAVAGPVEQWIAEHSDSFPPVIMNLTDGAYSDLDPAPVVWDLMTKRTSCGNVLVLNCHISQFVHHVVRYPNEEQAADLSGLARELFDLSSPLPERMIPLAESKGFDIRPGARGCVFDADQVAMIDFFDIGTRAIQDRVETG